MPPSQRALQNLNTSTTVKTETSSTPPPSSTSSTSSESSFLSWTTRTMSSTSTSPPPSPPLIGCTHPSSSSSSSQLYDPESTSTSVITTPYLLSSLSYATSPIPTSLTSGSESNVGPQTRPTSPQYSTTHPTPPYGSKGKSLDLAPRQKPTLLAVASTVAGLSTKSDRATSSDRGSRIGRHIRVEERSNARKHASTPYVRQMRGVALPPSGRRPSRRLQSDPTTTNSYDIPIIDLTIPTQPEGQEDRWADRIERLTGRRPRRWTTPPPSYIREAAMEEISYWDAGNDLAAQYSTLPLYPSMSDSTSEGADVWVDHDGHFLL